jgi:hypothetical protein
MLDGISAGAFVPLTKMETTIGRPGVQVAAIVRSGTSFVLKRIEGERPPVVNGKAMAADSSELRHGDTIELAGKRLEFVGPDGSVGVAELARAFSSDKVDKV